MKVLREVKKEKGCDPFLYCKKKKDVIHFCIAKLNICICTILIHIYFAYAHLLFNMTFQYNLVPYKKDIETWDVSPDDWDTLDIYQNEAEICIYQHILRFLENGTGWHNSLLYIAPLQDSDQYAFYTHDHILFATDIHQFIQKTNIRFLSFQYGIAWNIHTLHHHNYHYDGCFTNSLLFPIRFLNWFSRIHYYSIHTHSLLWI